MTSTMTSTLYPASSNLTVPSTQNTAPVLLYNCLYTHDLRRKAKRWQDGVLKYHTFNKRIMVYDVPRNFIGDTHWREPQTIQDGDELELEKGVLIQVGEEVRAERTETDLTELLEKRKPKPACDGLKVPLPTTIHTPSTPQTSSIAYAPIHTSTSTPFSQLRPKSLNALLGRPKGPVGRAMIPSKSPAEQRHGKENNALDDARSPKRRRIQHFTDSLPTGSIPTSRHVDAVLMTAKGAITSISASAITKHTSTRESGLVNQAPSESMHHGLAAIQPNKVLTSHKLQRQSRINQQTEKDSPDNVQIVEESPSIRAVVKQKRQDPTRKEQRSSTIRSSSQKNASGSSKTAQAPSNYTPRDQQSIREGRSPYSEDFEDEPRPENRLRIVSSKPRKKLMYRDLLPQKAPPQHIRQSTNGQNPSNRASDRPFSKSPDKRANSSLSAFHQAQQDRLDSRLSKCKETVEIVEDDAAEPLLSLRDDEGEDTYTPDKSPTLNSAHDPEVLDSLFLSQSSPDEPLSNSSSLRLDQPKDPPEVRNTFKQPRPPRDENMEGNLHIPDDDDESLPDQSQNSTVPESVHQAQFSPEVPTKKISAPYPDPENPPTEPHNKEDILTSTQAARTLTEMDSLLLRRPVIPPNLYEPQPKPKLREETTDHRPPLEPRTETIKAAMPPQPVSRPFQRSVSDLTTHTKPNTNTKRTTRGLLKSFSNDFTPLNVVKPPRSRPPPIHIHSTNLYAASDDKKTDLIPDSRPSSAKEQSVEPWS
ncbi:MAG: hypothetical protein L6R38_002889, partial [Xanthoria sp. 2 TBL-2021]